MRILKSSRSLPIYLDGFFSVCEFVDDPQSDYPMPILKVRKAGISFSELEIFDTTKSAYKSAGVEVVRKIRTRPIHLDSKLFVKIGEDIYKVENAVTAFNSSGFEETDITLSKFTESFQMEDDGS